MDINQCGISELLHLTKKRCGKYILIEIMYDDIDDGDENGKYDGCDDVNDDGIDDDIV
jgi:hypothetical protein